MSPTSETEACSRPGMIDDNTSSESYGELSRLPPELLLIIVDNLPKSDLKTLRLVSRKLSDHASQRLFGVVRIEEHYPPSRSEPQKLLDPLQKSQDPNSASPSHSLYSEDCHFNAEGTEIMYGLGMNVLVSERLKKFVQRVIIYNASILYCCKYHSSLVLQPWTVELPCHATYQDTTVGKSLGHSIFRALFALSHSSVTWIVISGDGDYGRMFRAGFQNDASLYLDRKAGLDSFNLVLPRVASLHLKFTYSNDVLEPRRLRRKEMAGAFADMLERCSNLASLSLQFRRELSSIERTETICLEDYWPLEHTWKRLCDLSLTDIRARSEDLERLLRSHSSTLKSLCLQEINLRAAGANVKAISEKFVQEDLWQGIKEIVRNEMKLSKIVLNPPIARKDPDFHQGIMARLEASHRGSDLILY